MDPFLNCNCRRSHSTLYTLYFCCVLIVLCHIELLFAIMLIFMPTLCNKALRYFDNIHDLINTSDVCGKRKQKDSYLEGKYSPGCQ